MESRHLKTAKTMGDMGAKICIICMQVPAPEFIICMQAPAPGINHCVTSQVTLNYYTDGGHSVQRSQNLYNLYAPVFNLYEGAGSRPGRLGS